MTSAGGFVAEARQEGSQNWRAGGLQHHQEGSEGLDITEKVGKGGEGWQSRG